MKKFVLKIKKTTQGFTLVETLITILLVCILGLVLMSLYLEYGQLYALGEGQYATVGGSRQALSEISTYTAQAYRVLATQTVNGKTYNSSTTTLVLQLPAIDSSGSTINNTWDYVVFYTSTSSLYRYVQADSASARKSGLKQLDSALSSVAFTYNNADFTQVSKVSADLQSSITSHHITVTDHKTQTIILRNF